MAYVLVCDTMKATHPDLQTAVIGIDVLNTEDAALTGADGWLGMQQSKIIWVEPDK